MTESSGNLQDINVEQSETKPQSKKTLNIISKIIIVVVGASIGLFLGAMIIVFTGLFGAVC